MQMRGRGSRTTLLLVLLLALAQGAGAEPYALPLELELTRLWPGQAFALETTAGPYLVVRRSAAELERLRAAAPARTAERVREEVIVFRRYVSGPDCPLVFTPRGDERVRGTRLYYSGGLVDVCSRVKYDLAGRPFAGGDVPLVPLPRYRLVGSRGLVIEAAP